MAYLICVWFGHLHWHDSVKERRGTPTTCICDNYTITCKLEGYVAFTCTLSFYLYIHLIKNWAETHFCSTIHLHLWYMYCMYYVFHYNCISIIQLTGEEFRMCFYCFTPGFWNEGGWFGLKSQKCILVRLYMYVFLYSIICYVSTINMSCFTNKITLLFRTWHSL